MQDSNMIFLHFLARLVVHARFKQDLHFFGRLVVHVQDSNKILACKTSGAHARFKQDSCMQD